MPSCPGPGLQTIQPDCTPHSRRLSPVNPLSSVLQETSLRDSSEREYRFRSQTTVFEILRSCYHRPAREKNRPPNAPGDRFATTVTRVGTVPCCREGTEKFLLEFGPAQYHSVDDYKKGSRFAPARDDYRWRSMARCRPGSSDAANRSGRF